MNVFEGHELCGKDTGELRIDAGILSPCLGPLMTNHLLDASYGYLSLMAKSASALSGRRNRIEAWHQQSSHMYLTTRHEQTQRLQTHSKKRQKKLIFMSEQSSTDYNEHGMKPKLPGQARQCTFTKSRKRFASTALRILNCWPHMNKESCA